MDVVVLNPVLPELTARFGGNRWYYANRDDDLTGEYVRADTARTLLNVCKAACSLLRTMPDDGRAMALVDVIEAAVRNATA